MFSIPILSQFLKLQQIVMSFFLYVMKFLTNVLMKTYLLLFILKFMALLIIRDLS